MTRPTSHTEQLPKKCCGNCIFSHLVPNKCDLLCFNGDNIEIKGQFKDVYINNKPVYTMTKKEYARLYENRFVYPSDICNEWILDE